MSLSTNPPVASEQVFPRLPSGKVDVAAWMNQLGVRPIADLGELSGGVWPDDEPVDQFLAAREGWKLEGHKETGV